MPVRPVRGHDPFGAVCRSWTGLSPAERDEVALRLVGVPAGQAHIDDPGGDGDRHYAALVEQALAGDEVAFAWLATSHRPLLIARGRALFDRDPGEWGAVCLEVLFQALRIARRTTAGPWLRRRVSQQITHGLLRVQRAELARWRAEQATDPVQLVRFERPPPAGDPHPDLSAALEVSLAQLEPVVRAGFEAIASDGVAMSVACSHGLSRPALRQKMARARQQLRPQLAGYQRSA